MISQERLQTIFEYRDGHLWWLPDNHRSPQWNARVAGKRVGNVGATGYVKICLRPSVRNGLSRTLYTVEHRLIFCFHRGYYPKMIDHINGARDDNRIENLREATPALNAANCKTPRNNTTGCMGVTRSGDGRFEVRVSRNKKRHALGKYDSFEKAVAVYREAERKLLGDWRRVTDRAVVS